MELTDRLKVRVRPDQKTLIHQNWRNLLFLHWRYPADVIQKTLPKGLFVDTFNGHAYLGIIPFLIQNQRIAGVLSIPKFEHFLEMNVRTYVYDEEGVPGVWFYSLDINSFFAATMGRIYYHLPYVSSKFELSMEQEEKISLVVERENKIEFTYKPIESLGEASLNSLEFFLVERYILFSQSQKGLYRAQINHVPYFLYYAEVMHYSEEPFLWNGLPQVLRNPDHILFSPGVDVDIFKPLKIKTIRS